MSASSQERTLGRPRRMVARPAQPRRVRRSGRGEWSSARIAEALRAWTAEVGRPPRSYDWSPAAARAGGFALAGAQKWEHEFPRWPHHALVRTRYGSWRAALHAAGLPGPAPLAIERRERVQTAQRLQGQLSAHEIADLLGVSARTVRSYWRAGICARCGGPQISPTASSCADCIPFVALRRPTRTAIMRALRRWARETGAAPRVADWSEPGGKWEREYPAWPSAGDVRAHFETWPDALAHAGLRPHRRTWTRDTIIAALHAWAAARGRAPQQRDWERAGAEHPPASTVANTFGSWTAALHAAQLPTIRRAWNAHQLGDARLQRVAADDQRVDRAEVVKQRRLRATAELDPRQPGAVPRRPGAGRVLVAHVVAQQQLAQPLARAKNPENLFTTLRVANRHDDDNPTNLYST